MKTVIAIVVAMALAAVVGCESTGSAGGGASKDMGFTLAVPSGSTDVKQGELQTVTVSVRRGDYFRQDVTLDIKTAKDISVEPASVLVKAGDKPDVQLRIAAGKDAALSEYRVYVKATPAKGEPSNADFNVRVVAP